MFNEKKLSNLTLIVVLAAIITYSIFLQFALPTFCEADEYYHIAATNFLKNSGPHYDFRWAQFSTFKKYFSDKEFLFHLLTIPFLSLSKSPVLSGKYAIIFFDILFIAIYAFILKRYLPAFLTACLLLLPFVNFSFITYFMRLRPATLAIMLTILGIYFLINKKWIKVFIVSFLFTLAHVSFLTIIIFALICELARVFLHKSFFIRNIYASVIGVLLGCLLHPNNPNNWLSMHLNAILVPFYTSGLGVRLFGAEFLPGSSKSILIFNYSVFLSFYLILWVTFISRVRLSLSTLVWWACTSFYLILSFLSFRYWYVTDALFFIFLASYLKDWLAEKHKELVISRAHIFIITYAIVITMFFSANINEHKNNIVFSTEINTHYENAAMWMNKNIPAGETIFHAGWSDSPTFICLNPKNNYLVVLDPIYMFYKYPRVFSLYLRLEQGRVKKPHVYIKKLFKANYGYASNSSGLYYQVKGLVKKKTGYFRIVYEDNMGIIFKVL